MEELIRFELNGKPAEIRLDPELTLMWVLRNQFGLTGTKYGCGLGFCGACTVLIDFRPVRSCMLAIQDVTGRKVLTIEGLATNGTLHPIQKAFVENDALQCGFCTPGMIMSVYGLLLRNPGPTRQEIIDGLEQNLCRCGAHIRIIKAVEDAARQMNGEKKP